jgi:integrase
MILIHAIRNAMVDDLVARNVADLAAVPIASPGRPSGGPLDATHVRMDSKRITERAGLGRDWTPRELRHTFVSLLSDSGVPIEQIADAVGHSSTRAAGVVHRHQLRPVTRTAAIAPGPLFESRGKTNGGQN